MQNAAFQEAGLDWAYVALPVEPERLEPAVAGLVALGFEGANVTIPHKTGVLAFCDELDHVASRGGSVNTPVIREGRALGSSTDGLAVTGAVEAEGARCSSSGGGAAQAVATALVDAGSASVRSEHARPRRRMRSRPACAAWRPTLGRGRRRVAAADRDADLASTRRRFATSCSSTWAASGRSWTWPTSQTGATRRSSRLPGVQVASASSTGSTSSSPRSGVVRALDGRAAPVEVMQAAVRERK